MGFKSFPDKTSLEFSPGLTAIVGPNGSGKSNVADAVRWVLGGQSPRLLRTSRMDEVIFSGTDRRRPLNVARVRLTLDNEDGALSVPFSEVQITREISRAGDSTYQLNGTPCRLKDIVQLLAGTGLGRDSYSLIGQGRVEEMINAHGDERRGLLEEAAGITRYRNQRQETLRRLQRSEQDLQRLHDILTEVESQLGPLQEQADKARRYRQLVERLRSHELSQLLGQWKEAEEQVTKSRRVYSQRQQVVRDTRSELEAVKEKLRLARQEEEEHHRALEALDKVLGESEMEERELSIRTSAHEQTLASVDEEIDELEMRVSRLQSREDGRGREKNQATQTLDETVIAYARVQQEYQERQESMEALRAVLKRFELQVETAKSDALETLNEAAAERNQLRQQELEKCHLEAMYGRLQKELAGLAQAKERWDGTRGSLRQELAQLEEQVEQLRRVIEDDERLGHELEQKIQRVRHEKETCQTGVERVQSRLNVVREMLNSYEGYSRGPRQLLRAAETEPNLRGVLGSVADLLAVEADYQKAIEAALGGALQYIITHTDEVAEACIEYLKTHRAGRATFLPLNLVKPFGLSDRERRVLQEMPGASAALLVVQYDDTISRAIEHLLGRVLIARDLKQALAMGRQTDLRSRIATLSGELIAPGGVLTGGGRPTGGVPLLGRKHEISQLQQRLEGERMKWQQWKEEEESSVNQLNTINETLHQAQREWSGLQVRREGVRSELRSQESEGDRLTREQESRQRELQVLTEQMQELNASMEETAASAAKLEQSASTVRDTAERTSQEYEKKKKAFEQAGVGLTDLRVRVAGLKEQKVRHQEQLLRAEADLVEVQTQLEECAGRRESLRARKAKAKAELEEIDMQRGTIQEHRDKMEKEKEACGNRYQDARKVRTEWETKEEQVQRREKGLETRLHNLALEKARREMEADHIRQKLRERYGLDAHALPDDLDGPPSSEEDVNIDQLREELSELGEVNLGAIGEYQRLTERSEFLRQQKADVEAACQDLQRAIQETDKQIEAMFAATLEAVRTSFQTLFRRLFGGGRADLVATDGDNPIQSGIEIVVQPPGRKLRNINLLSGGEKALTAIALLFSLLTIRPSPFCFLDEIEAALDESNAERFLKLLREFESRTQFILITHQKITMEAADVLYGVTMQETGISRLISVNLVEASEGSA